MRKKLLVLATVGGVVLSGVLWESAQAQLIQLPSVPFTVADCHAGDHWGPSPSHGGLLRCLPNNPPPAPTCPSGQVQTVAPIWNGESWSAPSCALPANNPPPPPPPAPTVTTITYGCPGWTIYSYSDGSVQRVWDPDNPNNWLVQNGGCSDRG
ncbi:hypothetical protein LMG18095_04533 [Ralstonia thomasii]|uniref:Secreted protein n=1 Tax=Ralstonia thomasii TaxID=3058596 RepID=A0ABM9JXW3_9RALS|nr:hypothetical protein LMG18095_04533 [Ralstonia sp. LMG 18095]